MTPDIDPEHALRSHFFAGAAGSAVALRFAPGASWLERVANVASGSVVAGICSPALVEWFHVSSPGIGYAIAFGVGMFGLSLAAAIIQAIRELELSKIIAGWLGRRE